MQQFLVQYRLLLGYTAKYHDLYDDSNKLQFKKCKNLTQTNLQLVCQYSIGVPTYLLSTK